MRSLATKPGMPSSSSHRFLGRFRGCFYRSHFHNIGVGLDGYIDGLPFFFETFGFWPLHEKGGETVKSVNRLIVAVVALVVIGCSSDTDVEERGPQPEATSPEAESTPPGVEATPPEAEVAVSPPNMIPSGTMSIDPLA